jgi:hypothetical protein
MKNNALSEKIVESTEKIIRQWLIANPDDSLLNVAQQTNYAAVILKNIGYKYESEFKANIKGKTTNDLH